MTKTVSQILVKHVSTISPGFKVAKYFLWFDFYFTLWFLLSSPYVWVCEGDRQSPKSKTFNASRNASFQSTFSNGFAISTDGLLTDGDFYLSCFSSQYFDKYKCQNGFFSPVFLGFKELCLDYLLKHHVRQKSYLQIHKSLWLQYAFKLLYK